MECSGSVGVVRFHKAIINHCLEMPRLHVVPIKVGTSLVPIDLHKKGLLILCVTNVMLPLSNWDSLSFLSAWHSLQQFGTTENKSSSNSVQNMGLHAMNDVSM